MTSSCWLRTVAFICLLGSGNCAPTGNSSSISPNETTVLEPPAGFGLQTVPLPNTSSMEDAVKLQVQTAQNSLRQSIEDPATTPGGLGQAYGEMANLLMAARDLDAAEPYYLNAQALAPNNRHWSYYLGHLYRNKGPLEEAVANFEHARQLAPNDVATLVWLGEVYLSLGQSEQAQPLFEHAVSINEMSAAAWFGLGRAALNANDFSAAVASLERALAINPQATAIHYPLGLALRGIGNAERAEAHLEQQGNIEAHPVDPLMWELDNQLQSVQAFKGRARYALDAGEWAAAVELLSRALEFAPMDSSLHFQLGTALWQLGDPEGAQYEFERIQSSAPEFPDAQVRLSVLLDERGRSGEAIARLTDTLDEKPDNLEVRVALAGILGRNGQPNEALEQYTDALTLDGSRSDAAFGYAMNLVRLERFADARDYLETSAQSFPDQESMFIHPLARLLAAAPADGVRDGQRAMLIVETLLEDEQSFVLGETYAMVLAELGQFTEAVAVQRDLIEAAEQTGAGDLLSGLRANLLLYERGEPCRTPWTPTELP